MNFNYSSNNLPEEISKSLKQHNVTSEDFVQITKIIKSSRKYVDLQEPVKEGSGVVGLSFVEPVIKEVNSNDLVIPAKFTPMSGAASRMFGFLERYLSDNLKDGDSQKVEEFISGLDLSIDSPKFPFVDQLIGLLSEDNYSLSELISKKDYKTIIDYVLSERGLSYRGKPKAVIPFHVRDGRAVTSLEEHMKEATLYAGGELNITISPEHQSIISETIDDIKKSDSGLKDVVVNISYQKHSTDSVGAYIGSGELVTDENNHLVFFPAGHGSLINNIEEIGKPLILRNVDNVPYNENDIDTVKFYHQQFTKLLCRVKSLFAQTIKSIDDGDIDQARIDTFMSEIKGLGINLVLDYNRFHVSKIDEKKSLLRTSIDRPFKIVGVVENKGEPGGGPFYINYNGLSIVSIVEKDEISPEQNGMISLNKYFNPVDLLVDPTDYSGKQYSLREFINDDRFFLVKKSYKGEEIIRVERPGLWNGAMDGWNSIFVEMPLETFAPVKEVNDLLRENHQK